MGVVMEWNDFNVCSYFSKCLPCFNADKLVSNLINWFKSAPDVDSNFENFKYRVLQVW